MIDFCVTLSGAPTQKKIRVNPCNPCDKIPMIDFLCNIKKNEIIQILHGNLMFLYYLCHQEN